MTESAGKRGPVPRWTWLFLAGPLLWYLYFWIVYLAAEVGCAAGAGGLVTWVTIGMSVATIVAIAYYTLKAARGFAEGGGDERPLVRAGYLLGGLFLVATLFVGVPAMALQPC